MVGQTPAPPADPVLQIGIVQRFGSGQNQRLTIQGDRLRIRIPGADNRQPEQIVVSDRAVFEVQSVPLTPPVGQSRVILSHHRSYENAEASALYWQQRGIATEIAQPRRWQVWANRRVYATPLTQQAVLLLARAQGNRAAEVVSETLTRQNQVAVLVNGMRYQGQNFSLTGDRGVLRVNGRPYAGQLRLQPNAYGTFTLVNAVPLETYLRGVVPHEIGYDAPLAAVEAQAVLARTYALASRQRFAVDDYELCADTQCQVYRGLTDTTATADRAIANTRGQILTYQNRPIDALYSSTTGGITANFNDLWDGTPRPYLQSVWDAATRGQERNPWNLSSEAAVRAFLQRRQGFNEVGWRTFRWRRTSTLPEMRQTLQRFLQLSGDRQTKIQSITALTVAERAASGRVVSLVVQTDQGALTVRKDEIIDAFHAPDSTFFYLEPIRQGDRLVGYAFIGGGLGHGVGMSQTGSYALARQGRNYRQILDFYYTNTRLQTLQSAVATGSWRFSSPLITLADRILSPNRNL